MSGAKNQRDPAGDLLSPTLLDHRRPPEGAHAPWRLGSQVYVAFLGGSLAATAIAIFNARRHGMPLSKQIAIAVVGVATFAGVLVAAAVLSSDSGDRPSELRVAVQVASVLGWGVMYLIQRPYDRIFTAFGEREYESLVGPGLIAVLVLGAVQVSAVLAVSA